jgi:hypothetical protein
MTDLPTNAFEVFSSEARGNENHLTRALLVLLRLCPLAHEVWLRQVGLGDLGLPGVGEATYAFQSKVSGAPVLEDQVEPPRGISVFISREPAYNSGKIINGKRKQIPDGLITYSGPDTPIVVVVESKVRDAADAFQARDINLAQLRPSWNPPEPVELRWSTLIDELWKLVDLQATSGSERRLLFDFFDFVDRYYREVGPYSTLRRCANVRERVRRRCRSLLADATQREAHPPSRGNGPYVEIEGPPALPKRVAFDLDESGSNLRLSFWPADIPSQAHAFYSEADLIADVLELSGLEGWGADSNMHFGHFQAGYAWLPRPPHTDLSEYLEFWHKNQDLIATVYRPGDPKHPDRDWDSLLDRLSDAGIISSREGFDRDFVSKGRNKADVRPGLEIYRYWSLEEAGRLDDDGALVKEIQDAFELSLETFDRVD